MSKKLFNPMIRDWEEIPDKRSINKKLSKFDKKIWKENHKIVSLIKKSSNLDLRYGRKNQRFMVKRGFVVV